MSLIFGVNLSDRIYLSADTRVSYLRDKTKISWVKDNILKIEQINEDIAVAVAGSVQLSKYLISKLKESKLQHLTLSELKVEIKDWVANTVDEYLKTHVFETVCLLFAGIDRSKRKQIHGKRLIDLTKIFQDKTNSPMVMKSILYKGISSNPGVPNPTPTLSTSNTDVFAIISDYQNGVLELHETQWGEYLAYGPKGFTRSDIPITTFGQLEFEDGCGNPFRDSTLITAMIKSIEKDKKLFTVGGGVITYMGMDPYGIVLPADSKSYHYPNGLTKPQLLQEIKIVDDKVCYIKEGQDLTELISFLNYKTEEGSYSI